MGGIGDGELSLALLLGALDAALDLADVLRIFVDAIAIVGAEAGFQSAELLDDGVEDALFGVAPSETLLGAGAIAEEALKHDARIHFHGQRRRGRAPRDGVHVTAAITDVAIADEACILDAEFERRQRRILADFLRGNLIDGDACVELAVRFQRMPSGAGGTPGPRGRGRRRRRPAIRPLYSPCR